MGFPLKFWGREEKGWVSDEYRRMEGHALSDWFDEFALWADPAVVMRMPGCYDKFVNESHKREFPDLKVPVAVSIQDSIPILDQPAPVACPLDESCDESKYCYCVKGNSILALLSDPFCSFEVAFKKLLEKGNSEVWEKGIGFLGLKVEGNWRSYDVHRVDSRLLPGEYSKCFVEARLRRLWDMTVEVSNSAFTPDGVLPTEIKCRVKAQGQDWLPERTYLIPREEGYIRFGRALHDARERLKKDESSLQTARRYVLDQVKEIKDQDRYEPIENFTCCLFAGSNVAMAVTRISEVLDCLMDALVVVGDIKGKIEESLSGLNVSTPAALSREAQFEMFRATIPMEGLERMPSQRRILAHEAFEQTKRESRVSPAKLLERPHLPPKGEMQKSLSQARAAKFLSEFEKEVEAFERLLPGLLESSPGLFVAIHGGEIVDRDENKSALMRRVTRDYRGQCVLVEEVRTQSNAVAVIDTLDN